SRPHAPVERATADRPGDVLRLDILVTFQVSDRPGHTQELVMGTGGKPQIFHRCLEDRQRLRLQPAEPRHLPSVLRPLTWWPHGPNRFDCRARAASTWAVGRSSAGVAFLFCLGLLSWKMNRRAPIMPETSPLSFDAIDLPKPSQVAPVEAALTAEEMDILN